MTSVPSIQSSTLDLPPSCIAFCPAHSQYFVVGTYYLHPQAEDGASAETAQKRTGSLILFRLDNETITQIETRQTDFAVLDVRWAPHSQQSEALLAVATSTGCIAFYRLDTKTEDAHLFFVSQVPVTEPSNLVLSILWHPSEPNIIGATLSNGEVNLYHTKKGRLWDENAVAATRAVHVHELEAWTLAFNHNHAMKLLSGGDDMYIRCSSIDESDTGAVQWQDRKVHQAGVTAILPLKDDLIVTGSYDDHIRLLTIPIGGRPHVRAEMNLGGGVWQLKMLQAEHDLSYIILASCMHAGCRVLRLCCNRDAMWGFHIIAKFEEHQSMNYGSDVQPSNGLLKSTVSTSFYDKLLCLWRCDIDSCEDEEARAV